MQAAHNFKSFVAAYDFQSAYGLDCDGWRICTNHKTGEVFLRCMIDGELQYMSEAEYCNIREGVSA